METDSQTDDQRLIEEIVKRSPGPAPHRLPDVSSLTWNGEQLRWAIEPSERDLPEDTIGVAYRSHNGPLLKAGETILGMIDSGVCTYPHTASNTLYTVSFDIESRDLVILRRMPVNELKEFPKELIKDYGYAVQLHTSLEQPVTFSFKASRETGVANVEFPAEFKDMGTFFFYVTSDDMNSYFLLEIDTVNGTVATMPQDWLTNGNYDVLYEWPMGVIRSTYDGKMYGEGMRLGIFELSSNGRKIARWVLH